MSPALRRAAQHDEDVAEVVVDDREAVVENARPARRRLARRLGGGVSG
jgi:hypothetical protein